MHRCFVPSSEWDAPETHLGTDEVHHLHVLRVAKGDAVMLFDGAGREAQAIVKDSKRGLVEWQESAIRTYPSPPVQIVLFQAIPKGHKMDLIVEKATELGVASIVPVMTQRTIVRLNDRQGVDRLKRWQRVARAAARQCGTRWLPDIQPARDFESAVSGAEPLDLLFVASVLERTQSLCSVLGSVDRDRIKRVGVIIGPEGDLTEDEIQLATEKGAVGVSFGPLVFRVETAALYTSSVLAYHFLYRDEWLLPSTGI